jgi:3D (Asp-Asp-Asp) domain-containing protein
MEESNSANNTDQIIQPRSLDRSVVGICFRRFYWWCHTSPVRTGLAIAGIWVVGAMFMHLVSKESADTMRVRVTAYWSVGVGTDKWTARGMSSTGVPLRENQSAAVDPAVIPYGSQIVWPKGRKIWKAVDTGGAVKNRTAAKAWGEDTPVVDVFFEHRKDAIAFTYQVPKFITVEIYPPEEGWKEQLTENDSEAAPAKTSDEG